jgi:PAS domain-containing protein
MGWLEEEDRRVLEYWLSNTDTPLLAVQEDGTILEVNHALLRIMKYTEPELLASDKRKGKTWMELSVPDSDLEADIAASQRLVEGADIQYWCRKHFLPKGSSPEPVLIHVLRYPPQGDYLCSLVSVHFLSQTENRAHATALEAMEARLVGAMQVARDNLDDSERLSLSLLRLIRQYPKRSVATLMAVLSLIFGDRLVLAVQTVMSILSSSGSG